MIITYYLVTNDGFQLDFVLVELINIITEKQKNSN